mmetsp:Transcript_18250/g.21827  ORF Transcript_18250/g.21827 Transcript_18250/m.21827 type:complete len:200 (-) Transcript_18250:552-1151(-)
MVAQIVRPVSAIFFMALMTTNAPRESNPDVGSSRNKMEGEPASSTAIASRFLCSKDSPVLSSKQPTCRFFSGVSSSILRTLSTNRNLLASSLVASLRESSFKRAENATVSWTVSWDVCTSNCSTYPELRRKLVFSCAKPLSSTVPVISPEVFLREITSIKVVFPAPELPIKAHMRPAIIAPLTLSSNLNVSSPVEAFTS